MVLGVTLVAALVVILGLLDVAEDVLESVATQQGIATWDRPVLDWMIAHRTPTANAVIAWFSNTGGPLWQPIVTGLVVVFLWYRWKDPTPVVLTAVAVGGALAMTVVGKRVVGRLRPPLSDAVPPYETSFSFPSGHSLNSVVISGILAYLVIRHLWNRPVWVRWLVGVLFGLYAATMGLSRVYLGHHWWTDVLGAWALGLAWLALVVACHRVWRVVRHREERQPIEAERNPGTQ